MTARHFLPLLTDFQLRLGMDADPDHATNCAASATWGGQRRGHNMDI
jgi:hypothetical protein